MSTVYYKKLPDFEYNLIHLYEHLIVGGFTRYLRNKNLLPELFDQYGGVTFDELIYIATDDEEVAISLDQYLRMDHNFTSRAIANELLNIGAEHNAVYCISDQAKLTYQLKQIDDIPFCSLESDETKSHYEPMGLAYNKPPASSVISVASGVNQYDLISINFVLDCVDIADMAVLSNMDSVLKNMVNNVMSEQYGAYPDANVIENSDDGHGICTACDYYINKKVYTVEGVRRSIASTLTSIDFSKHQAQLRRFFRKPYSSSGIIYDYNSIGLFISQHELRKYLTVERANSVFHSLKVSEINVFDDKRECNDIYLRSDRRLR